MKKKEELLFNNQSPVSACLSILLLMDIVRQFFQSAHDC